MKSSPNKLLVLTTAALSLPGMYPKSAQAETMPEQYTTSYRYTEYKELGTDAIIGGAGPVVEDFDRYEISVHQLSFKGPVSSNVSVSIDVISETLTGASPWYVVPTSATDDTPIQVMSGATIEEKRDEINGSLSVYGDNSRLGFGGSYSAENDYESVGLNVNNSWWFNNKNTTLDLGVSFSRDLINPTQAIGINRITEEEKTSNSVFGGLSQVLNKTLLIGASASYTIYDGFLSDPYKQASVQGVLIPDSRPEERKQAAIDLKLRKYVESFSMALHFDYRLYDDSWRVSSNTFSFGAYKNIDTWQAVFKVRYYDQSSASFYRDFYRQSRADRFYSSDYRLSEYDAISFKIGLNKMFDSATFRISYENYASEGNGTNPGLEDFNFLTLGLD